MALHDGGSLLPLLYSSPASLVVEQHFAHEISNHLPTPNTSSADETCFYSFMEIIRATLIENNLDHYEAVKRGRKSCEMQAAAIR
jgi:hypothetical protein